MLPPIRAGGAAEIKYLYDIGLIKQGLTLTADMNRSMINMYSNTWLLKIRFFDECFNPNHLQYLKRIYFDLDIDWNKATDLIEWIKSEEATAAKAKSKMPAIVASAESTAEEATETANVYTRANVNSSLRKVKSLFSLKSRTALHESIPAPAPELHPHRGREHTLGPIRAGANTDNAIPLFTK